jgi:two-component system, OmpR family, phosphate regulon sensor histidine kinase PhoR
LVDVVHFGNVIKNLVENAYKYSGDNPKIEISTDNIDGGVLISVKDNGIGIDSAYQPYIFDKFYRVPTGDLHNVKGFGIGLYYVKVIISAHGGSICVKSEANMGSKFDIILPVIN